MSSPIPNAAIGIPIRISSVVINAKIPSIAVELDMNPLQKPVRKVFFLLNFDIPTILPSILGSSL